MPEKHRNQLADSTDFSKLGKDLTVYLDAIEETSHFVYLNYYFKEYQKKACSAMVELIAVLDKYNLVEKLHQQYYKEPLDKDDISLLLSFNASANNQNSLGKTEGAYVIGHRMGVFFIDLLNKFYTQVFQETKDRDKAALEAGKLMSEFYHSDNRSQLIFLINQGFPIETYSDFEAAAVRKILAELDIDESQLTKV